MNFSDYINQNPVQKLSIGSVLIDNTDYSIICTYADLTLITLHHFNFQYVIKKGCKNLFTMDNEGNPKNLTVFKIK